MFKPNQVEDGFPGMQRCKKTPCSPCMCLGSSVGLFLLPGAERFPVQEQQPWAPLQHPAAVLGTPQACSGRCHQAGDVHGQRASLPLQTPRGCDAQGSWCTTRHLWSQPGEREELKWPLGSSRGRDPTWWALKHRETSSKT